MENPKKTKAGKKAVKPTNTLLTNQCCRLIKLLVFG